MTAVVEKVEQDAKDIITAEAEVAAAARQAGWLSRAGALVIDVVPGTAVAVSLVLLGLAALDPDSYWWVYTAGAALLLVLLAVTRWLIPSLTGWTLGRSVFAIRVVHRGDGAPAGILRLFLRDVAHLLDTAALFIGWLWPLWDSRHRTFQAGRISRRCATVLQP